MSTGLNHSTFIADMITSLLYKRYTCSLNACYSTLYDGTINVFEIYLEISLYPAIFQSFSLHCKTYPICGICWKHRNNIETWLTLNTTES